MRTTTTLSGMIALACLAGTARAQLHAGDIALSTSTGVIRTGAGVGAGFVEDRVFPARLGDVIPGYTDSPGFDCPPGTFPAGSRVGFRILDALREWNGVDFSVIPEERMEVGALSSLVRTTPVGPGLVEGFTLSVSGTGIWHRHYDFTLLAPQDSGVYLLNLSLTSTAGVGESAPFWLVFDNNANPAAFAAAVSYVETVLAAPQPTCDSVDFNNDGVFPDDADVVDFLTVLAGGACPTASCNDLDFNNDGVFPDDADLERFLLVLGGGEC